MGAGGIAAVIADNPILAPRNRHRVIRVRDGTEVGLLLKLVAIDIELAPLDLHLLSRQTDYPLDQKDSV
jgi:hypothetical protein